MPLIEFVFLGPFQVNMDGVRLSSFATDKVRALLAYIALEPDHAHSRRTLAGLFWPEQTERRALANLRHSLHRLRHTLNATSSGPGEQVLSINRQTIQFRGAAVSTDVSEFETLLTATAVHAHEDLYACATCLSHMERAVALYRGELLAGFSLPDAPSFEEWLLLRREALHHQTLMVLKQLITAYVMQGELALAHHLVMRQLTLDPYQEETHRQLMRILARRGLTDQALVQYDKLRQLLSDEMGVEPDAETIALYEQLRTGNSDEVTGWQAETVHVAAPPQPALTASVPSPGDDRSQIPVASAFVGRSYELSRLEQWLVQDRCRLVAVLGIGGVGKTTLAAHTARRVAPQFDRLIWRSLLNAPRLVDLLPGLLQDLAKHQLAGLPKTVDEQLSLLIVYLRQQRVLLVLDNLESMLDAERVGRFRAGYEPYGHLLLRVATSEHRSALLLTTRERPTGFIQWEGDTPLVRSLLLEGLDDAAGHELLTARGVAGPIAAKAALVARYSGNPLALRLVADTVQELFAGDIDAFLAEDVLVFDDIRSVLDQQFTRLSKLEREILYWLAINRDATSLPELHQELLQAPQSGRVVDALRNLQRRALIEREREGLGLSNVIIEYLTNRLVEVAIDELISGAFNLLHHHALLRAQAKEYVRQSQARLILAPIGEALVGRYGLAGVTQRLREILAQVRQAFGVEPSYAGGNILNLCLHLGLKLSGFDFSQLAIREADLRNAVLQHVDLSGADLATSIFTDTFRRVEAVALSPDSQFLAAAGDGGEIRVWRTVDSHPLALLHRHANTVTSLAFSPDGSLLASASVDESVRLWDLQTAASICVLKGHQEVVHSVAFSPNGALLASAGSDGFIRLWAVPSGRRLGGLNISTGIWSITFHPGAGSLAISSLGQGVYLWDAAEMDQLIQQGDPDGLAKKSDLLHLTAGGDRARYRCLTFSSDGNYLAAATRNGAIDIWERRGWRHLHRLMADAVRVNAIVFAPNSHLLVSGGNDQTIRMWQIPSGRLVNTIFPHQGSIWSIAIGQDGRTMVSGGEDALIRTWGLQPDGQVDPVQALYGYTDGIYALAFTPDGKLLAASGFRESIHLWNIAAATTTPAQIVPLHSYPSLSISFSPDGRYLASASDDNSIQLWDRTSGYRSHLLNGYESAIRCVAFSANGRLLASGGEDAVIYIWDTTEPDDAEIVQVLTGHTAFITSLSFSLAGDVLASSSWDGAVRLWHTQRWEELAQFEGEDGSWLAVLSPDGRMLACNGPHASIRLLDLTSDPPGRLIRLLEGHRRGLGPWTAAFSPDGSLLASGSADKTVRVWDVDSGKERFVLTGHSQYVRAVAFHPGGEILVSGGFDGSIKLWSVRQGTRLATLHIPGPYAGTNVAGVTGISQAQKTALLALGAVERDAE